MGQKDLVTLLTQRHSQRPDRRLTWGHPALAPSPALGRVRTVFSAPRPRLASRGAPHCRPPGSMSFRLAAFVSGLFWRPRLPRWPWVASTYPLSLRGLRLLILSPASFQGLNSPPFPRAPGWPALGQFQGVTGKERSSQDRGSWVSWGALRAPHSAWGSVREPSGRGPEGGEAGAGGATPSVHVSQVPVGVGRRVGGPRGTPEHRARHTGRAHACTLQPGSYVHIHPYSGFKETPGQSPRFVLAAWVEAARAAGGLRAAEDRAAPCDFASLRAARLGFSWGRPSWPCGGPVPCCSGTQCRGLGRGCRVWRSAGPPSPGGRLHRGPDTALVWTSG